MASSLPTPVAAAIGIVPAVFEGFLRLPGRALALPVVAISNALNTLDAVRREYDDLAQRGERLVGSLRGDATVLKGTVEDAAGTVVSGAPFGQSAAERARRAAASAADAVSTAGDAVQETTAAVRDTAAEAASIVVPAAAQATGAVADLAADGAQAAADALQDAQPDEQPKGAPTPKATQPDTSRVDSAASPAVQQAVEQVAAGAGQVLAHDELPLADYDHMTLGSLRGRMRSLDLDQLVQVRAYEKAHADRLPIVTMLDNRIAKLATDASATPSGPVSTEPAPEQRLSASTAATVSPATTNAPPVNPPSQGVPTNPAQPR